MCGRHMVWSDGTLDDREQLLSELVAALYIFREKGCFSSNNCYNESTTTKDKGQASA